MTTSKQKIISVYMPEEEHKRFKASCKAKHTTMANALLHMAINFSNKTEKELNK